MIMGAEEEAMVALVTFVSFLFSSELGEFANFDHPYRLPENGTNIEMCEAIKYSIRKSDTDIRALLSNHVSIPMSSTFADMLCRTTDNHCDEIIETLNFKLIGKERRIVDQDQTQQPKEQLDDMSKTKFHDLMEKNIVSHFRKFMGTNGQISVISATIVANVPSDQDKTDPSGKTASSENSTFTHDNTAHINQSNFGRLELEPTLPSGISPKDNSSKNATDSLPTNLSVLVNSTSGSNSSKGNLSTNYSVTTPFKINSTSSDDKSAPLTNVDGDLPVSSSSSTDGKPENSDSSADDIARGILVMLFFPVIFPFVLVLFMLFILILVLLILLFLFIVNELDEL